MMLEIDNYGEIIHNHRNCKYMSMNGTCRKIIHEPAFLRKHVKIRNRTIEKQSEKFCTQEKCCAQQVVALGKFALLVL